MTPTGRIIGLGLVLVIAPPCSSLLADGCGPPVVVSSHVGSARFRGRVLEPDGTPAAGARVALYAPSELPSRWGAQGHALELPPPVAS